MEEAASSMYCHGVVSITDPSGVGEARRQAARYAAIAGLSEQDRSNVAIVVTELATNLSRYAQDGEVLLRVHQSDSTSGVEILSIDRGPGMDANRALQDGYSTGGTPGAGLGAVQRLSSEFDLFSTLKEGASRSAGTIVFSRVLSGLKSETGLKSEAADALFSWGVVSKPAPMETACGDTWRIVRRPGEIQVMVADGLGHGVQAAVASDVAAGVFATDRADVTLTQLLQETHNRMHGTRGAAVAAARIDAASGGLKYAGIGNIAGTIRSRSALTGQGLVSHNGTLGAVIHKVQQFDYTCPSDGLLVMHSDGLQQRWSLDAYPGLANRHPAILAAVLYRDFTRGRDDVTVLVVRCSLASGVMR